MNNGSTGWRDQSTTLKSRRMSSRKVCIAFNVSCSLASRVAKPTYVLQVYVAGERGRSRWAVENLKQICEKELPGQYRIEVVDVSKNPRAAIENNLVALPAVFRTLPSPVRKFVGNWANEDHELVGFDLITPDKPKAPRRSRSSR
jgi:circadian clock protein KaiB